MDPPQDADPSQLVSYQFYAERDLWDRWKAVLPRTLALHDRLAELIAQDARARDRDADDETHVYPLRVSKTLWSDWRSDLPEGMAPHDRLAKLMREDALPEDETGWDAEEERTARLLVDRILHRSKTAVNALENDDDDKVGEELEEIQRLATMFDV